MTKFTIKEHEARIKAILNPPAPKPSTVVPGQLLANLKNMGKRVAKPLQ